MTDIDRLEQRLAAVERVVVDGDIELDELAAVTALAETVSELEERVDAHERRLADLEGTVQSIEGYVGNVESITDDVERQSAAAVATVDRLERRIDALEGELDDIAVDTLEADGERDDESETDAADGSTDADGGTFRFDGSVSETTRPEPEQSVAEVLDEDSKPFVDDIDRPTSSANQSIVDEAVESGDDDGGLFGSIRSRLG
ncbi:DUF7310 family coiled-coil domain-containing protein [Natrarchaeobius chitinivorans]|uniref:DUF7310 domain-containing protein n=1 Tax=Natrarchaeobius chitinivorans TaxID=1679083 RepID=A0A3N6LT61_NATCH|nr:hypothetical protein [Natrarchaeobius chitinivorans]RQG91807.1 hypothetical protein EA473_18595 [Natrarchaeobius chitinivorans]